VACQDLFKLVKRSSHYKLLFARKFQGIDSAVISILHNMGFMRGILRFESQS